MDIQILNTIQILRDTYQSQLAIKIAQHKTEYHALRKHQSDELFEHQNAHITRKFQKNLKYIQKKLTDNEIQARLTGLNQSFINSRQIILQEHQNQMQALSDQQQVEFWRLNEAYLTECQTYQFNILKYHDNNPFLNQLLFTFLE